VPVNIVNQFVSVYVTRHDISRLMEVKRHNVAVLHADDKYSPTVFALFICILLCFSACQFFIQTCLIFCFIMS
jgi:hypothetical protein